MKRTWQLGSGLVLCLGLAAILSGELPAWRLGGARMMEHRPLAPLVGTIPQPAAGAVILCRGDSNVRGSGGWRPWGRSGPVRAWCDWLAQARGAKAINRGIGGDTVAMGLARGGADQPADLVILLYGGNDAAARGPLGTRRPVPVDSFTADLAAMIRRYGPSRVLVLAPLPAGSRAADRRIAPYRAAAREAARQEGAAFLDPVSAFAANAALLDVDGVHLNTEGHRQLGSWLAGRLPAGRP